MKALYAQSTLSRQEFASGESRQRKRESSCLVFPGHWPGQHSKHSADQPLVLLLFSDFTLQLLPHSLWVKGKSRWQRREWGRGRGRWRWSLSLLPFLLLLHIFSTSPLFYFELAKICTSSCSSMKKKISPHTHYWERRGKITLRGRERESSNKSLLSLPPVQI